MNSSTMLHVSNVEVLMRRLSTLQGQPSVFLAKSGVDGNREGPARTLVSLCLKEITYRDRNRLSKGG